MPNFSYLSITRSEQSRKNRQGGGVAPSRPGRVNYRVIYGSLARIVASALFLPFADKLPTDDSRHIPAKIEWDRDNRRTTNNFETIRKMCDFCMCTFSPSCSVITWKNVHLCHFLTKIKVFIETSLEVCLLFINGTY